MLTTNATVFNERLVAKLRQFREAVVGCSIDGTGAVFEYIRSGGDWAETVRNIDRYRALDFVRMLPMDRLPSPRHYAQAAVFLASDDSQMITGIDLRVDAGAIAKYWPWVPAR